MTPVDPLPVDGPEAGEATILVVDDRAENLLALAAILEPLGQRVVSARSGTEALRQLLQEEFAVILLDVHMPGMSGYELATLVRERERTRHVPIIFLTAADMDSEHVFRGYRTGAVDYLVKPFDPNILRSKVSVFVDLHLKQREIERQADLLRQRELQQLAVRSEARYRFLAEAIPHHVWETRPDGSMVYASQRMVEELRRADPDVDVTLSLPVHPSEVAALREAWRAALQDGKPMEIELRLQRRDGSYCWFFVHALPYHEPDRRVSRWVGTNTNIDERKRDELRRAQLLEAEQTARALAERREREALFLAEATASLEEPGSYGERLGRLASICVPSLADFAVVEQTRADGRAEILAVHHRDPELGEELRLLREHHAFFADRAQPSPDDEKPRLVTFDEPAAVASDDPSTERAAGAADEWGSLAPAAVMLVPLNAPEGAGGTLVLGSSNGHRPFDEEDLGVAAELARRVMLVLDNARLYDTQGRIFRNLQLGLLAGISDATDGITVAVRYHAAIREMEIGGDWYDVFDLADDRIGIVVGDVVGQGLAAAAAMAKLRSALRALALTHEGPAAVLEHLDSYVEVTGDAAFTTVVYATLDPSTGALCYACAGHPPPLVLEPDGSRRWLEGGRSTPLGFARRPRREARTTIRPGSTLVLYTDGLVERRGEVIDVGLERLAEAATMRDGLGVEQFADQVIDSMLQGSAHDDDIALVCVRLERTDAEVFARRYPARPEQLRMLRRGLARWLNARGVQPEDGSDVLLACGEAFSNCIEHAYTGIGQGDVAIEVRKLEGEVRMSIRDFGHWRPPTLAVDHGRGIRIMEAVFDDVDIDRRTDGTTVSLRKRLRPSVEPTPAPIADRG